MKKKNSGVLTGLAISISQLPKSDQVIVIPLDIGPALTRVLKLFIFMCVLITLSCTSTGSYNSSTANLPHPAPFEGKWTNLSNAVFIFEGNSFTSNSAYYIPDRSGSARSLVSRGTFSYTSNTIKFITLDTSSDGGNTWRGESSGDRYYWETKTYTYGYNAETNTLVIRIPDLANPDITLNKDPSFVSSRTNTTPAARQFT
jgi:hypothetical protein